MLSGFYYLYGYIIKFVSFVLWYLLKILSSYSFQDEVVFCLFYSIELFYSKNTLFFFFFGRFRTYLLVKKSRYFTYMHMDVKSSALGTAVLGVM